MRVKKVVIENFGSYFGRQEVDLSLEDGNNGKNIVVVYGENGAGKTTFLTALVWCLYGRSMPEADNGWDAVWKKVRSDKYLNDEVKERDGKRAAQSVEIVFTGAELGGVPAREISVKRSRRSGGDKDDEVSVCIDGKYIVSENDNEARKEREEIIRENILPIEVAKFFLFDAQKIISFADFSSTQQNRDLKKSFSQVLGISHYEELRDRLMRIAQVCRTRRAKPEQKAKYDVLTAQEKGLVETLIPGKDAEILAKKDELEDVETNIRRVTDELIKISGGATQEDIGKLENDIAAAEADRTESGEKLKDVFPLIPFAVAGKLCSETREQLAREEIFKKRTKLKADVAEKIENVRRDLDEVAHKEVPFPATDAYRMKACLLESLPGVLLKYFGNTDYSEEELPRDFRTFLNKDTGFSEKFSNLLTQVVVAGAEFDEYRKNFEKASQLQSEKNRALDKLKARLEDDEVKLKTKDLDGLMEKQRELSEQKGVLDRDKVELSAKLNETKRQISALDKELRAAQGYDEKSELIDNLVKDIEKFISALQEQKKESLRGRILAGTRSLMHKEDLVADVSVEISSENGLRVRFLGKDGNELPQMSEGERQLCASALLQALSDESEIEFPVFIDSPLQKFDSEHAKNMVGMFYPNVSSQVVFFPLLGKELTREEYEILAPHVAKIWRIENTHNHSEFRRVTDISTDSLFPPQDDEESEE